MGDWGGRMRVSVLLPPKGETSEGERSGPSGGEISRDLSETLSTRKVCNTRRRTMTENTREGELTLFDFFVDWRRCSAQLFYQISTMAGMLNGKWTLLTSLFTSICMFLALRFRTKSSEILRIDYSNGTLSAGKALKQYIMCFNIQIEVNSEVSCVHFHLTYEPMKRRRGRRLRRENFFGGGKRRTKETTKKVCDFCFQN